MWALATRSRPNNCRRFIQAWIETEASSPVYVRMDECDPHLQELLSLPWPKEFLINVGPRGRLGVCTQEMLAKYPNEPWYGMLGDDVIPKTKHWDQLLIQRAGSHDIAAGNDVHEKSVRIIHPCVGGDLVRLVGFFAVPGCEHVCIDTFWEQLHHYFGRNNQMRDVILEHAHFFFNQAQEDYVYTEAQAFKQHDKRAFRDWKEQNWESLIKKIQDTYGWIPK